ncbi:hypothetical protein HUU05_13490 [candidate division KSB1 bacterium]|nr:hypothetical protein [candidate division KSB1 bacterium]
MKYSKGIVRVLFVVSGFLLFLLSYVFQLNQYLLLADGVKDFGVVLLSIVVLDFIWNAVGGDFSRKDFQSNGVSKVYLTPDEAEKDFSWIELVKKAKKRIDLQGLTLNYLATKQEFMTALRERIIAGVEVRVVLMSPDNPISNDAQHFLYPEDLKAGSKTSSAIFKRLEYEINGIESKRGQFTLLLSKEHSISIALRRFDDKLFVIHYQLNRHTADTPVYLIREGENSELFHSYLTSFDDSFRQPLQPK